MVRSDRHREETRQYARSVHYTLAERAAVYCDTEPEHARKARLHRARRDSRCCAHEVSCGEDDEPSSETLAQRT
jgi:hypothetical protein